VPRGIIHPAIPASKRHLIHRVVILCAPVPPPAEHILDTLDNSGGIDYRGASLAPGAEEIERSVNEIGVGTARSYAAEDVVAAVRLRLGCAVATIEWRPGEVLG